MKIIMKKMQKIEEEKCTTEIKLSKLNDQMKDQYKEISNKDYVIQTLRDEIQNYKVGVHDTKTMAISEMNVENKTLKSTVRKEIKTTTIVGTRLKVAGFICKKFLLEKKLSSK